MSKSVWTGSAWVPIKREWVWDGLNWVPVKSEKVWTGSIWKIAWAPPVSSAAVSLSKPSVQQNESFVATVFIAEGTPEGSVITLQRNGVTVTSWSPATGTTTLQHTMSVATVGTFSMTAVCVTAGGTYTTVAVTLTVVALPTDITLNGGHCHNINAALQQAKTEKKTLKLTGTFYCNTMVYVPDGVNVIATGAMFYVNSNSAVEGAVYNSGRFKNEANGNAPEYGQAGNFTWDGGTFDGNGEGIWTISHSPGFTIKNTTLYNYCSSGNTGHAIETNSSGGYDDPGGPFRVQILNNQFLGTNRGQRTNGNDEPCHFDWNWNGSGATAPVWNPGDTVSEYNQVMCHNVLVQGNTFHRKAETGGWAFALCAIGGHKSSDASMTSSYRHNHFLYKDNVIHGAVGSSGTNPDKGAIHSFFIRQGVVQNNQLLGCNANRLLTGENATDVTYCSASGNTHNGAGNPNSYVVSNSTGA